MNTNREYNYTCNPKNATEQQDLNRLIGELQNNPSEKTKREFNSLIGKMVGKNLDNVSNSSYQINNRFTDNKKSGW